MSGEWRRCQNNNQAAFIAVIWRYSLNLRTNSGNAKKLAANRRAKSFRSIKPWMLAKLDLRVGSPEVNLITGPQVRWYWSRASQYLGDLVRSRDCCRTVRCSPGMRYVRLTVSPWPRYSHYVLSLGELSAVEVTWEDWPRVMVQTLWAALAGFTEISWYRD
ncbi:hypothetical protein RRG08_020682 [Elysia crispata]|uniref:Uncharacterized protein n=1 Tax=Elysia crispata TaxID=231223 RepID=A0AAE0Z4G3_9GAST|nr:hypothetical protein RRG08_020682 [Elysia crispata]